MLRLPKRAAPHDDMHRCPIVAIGGKGQFQPVARSNWPDGGLQIRPKAREFDVPERVDVDDRAPKATRLDDGVGNRRRDERR